MPLTPIERRLAAGTRLRRIASTDPFWVAYDGAPLETLFTIQDGPLAGASLVAVSFGPAPLLPALAGVLVAPDHPPSRDPQIADPVACRRLGRPSSAACRSRNSA